MKRISTTKDFRYDLHETIKCELNNAINEIINKEKNTFFASHNFQINQIKHTEPIHFICCPCEMDS